MVAPDLPRKAEVVVVGAGCMGASIAFHLARRDVDVVLLEKGHVAGGATGHSGARGPGRPPGGGRGWRGGGWVHGGEPCLPPGAAPRRRPPAPERPPRPPPHRPKPRPGATTLRSAHRHPIRPAEPRVLSPFRER